MRLRKHMEDIHSFILSFSCRVVQKIVPLLHFITVVGGSPRVPKKGSAYVAAGSVASRRGVACRRRSVVATEPLHPHIARCQIPASSGTDTHR